MHGCCDCAIIVMWVKRIRADTYGQAKQDGSYYHLTSATKRLNAIEANPSGAKQTGPVFTRRTSPPLIIFIALRCHIRARTQQDQPEMKQ